MPIGVSVLARCNDNSSIKRKGQWIGKRDLSTTTGNDSATHHKIPSSRKSKGVWLAHLYVNTAIIPFFCAIPAATSAAPLSQTEFTALASRCAPAVPVPILEAIARSESGLNPWAIHDNTTGQKKDVGSRELAVADASRWVDQGDSVDVGLMQINVTNLHALGITVPDALDPCMSLAGGAAVLRAAYGGGVTPAEQQVALLIALSRYNTGTSFQGIMNGYARTVLENAGKREGALPDLPPPSEVPLLSDPNAPPSWNVSAAGIYAQQHGASWFIDFAPPSSVAGAPSGEPFAAAVRDQIALANVHSVSTQPTTR